MGIGHQPRLITIKRRRRLITMETSSSPTSNSSAVTNINTVSNPVRLRYNLSASNLIHTPLLTLLDYFGLLHNSPLSPRPTASNQEMQALIRNPPHFHDTASSPSTATTTTTSEEVSIRIIAPEDDNDDDELSSVVVADTGDDEDVESPSSPSTPLFSSPNATPQVEDGTAAGGDANNNANGDSTNQRYGIQQIARWFEQILPFSLLLLVVFIRQHLQGICFFGTIWVSAVLFKSNDILRKQTALKGERKISVLVCITLIFMLHVVSVYWWYQSADLVYPLVLLPPKAVPPFWHAIFVIVVNDTMVRQAAMVFKCILLMYYKNSGGHNYRRQGQMLTLVEYMVLLYRALLPTPVWYRFFLNKEYGSLFSSLTTGLYLTFKLTSIVQKVQLFFAALRALSRKEVHYGSYATSEQVNAAGDLCAICQEKMHAPIFLSCKHIFCEDCVAEWFERERTCPLCRALVRPADIKSYGDGSTSLLFQLF
ncbi:RING finger and transmembrane domain-containing protein 2 [Heracleum sosnowskyi]|uniref:RING finger and transmembrane domain-containing protein 2 n=1 Tax=Heracleum sosnowskyi TaxID=360622 RepID=A0AAD8GRZ0_9APIA|nr:RING finger and transmembrane domain-containing protein 2 [Heracleum sosnowskyi]